MQNTILTHRNQCLPYIQKTKRGWEKKVKEIVSLTIASKVSLNNSYQVGEIPYYKNFKTPDGGSTCF